MFLQMQGRRVVIVGGGEQATQKCRLILKTDAAITVLATSLDPELEALRMHGDIEFVSGPITPSSFQDTALVFIATGCPGLDASLHMLAKSAGATVNVVDQPDLCDAITPSIVDRSPVVVAIGTEGTAPVLARQIKTRMEELLEPRLGDLAALAGRLREQASGHLLPRKRRDLWRWVFNGPVRTLHAIGKERVAAKMVKDAILTGDFGSDTEGSVAFIEAAHSTKDLMTLRAVQRLQEADVIYYDRTVSTGILDLARRDAERVPVAPVTNCASLPSGKFSGTVIAGIRQGQRAVLIGSNEPLGIISAILDDVCSADIDCEIVPGIPATPSRKDPVPSPAPAKLSTVQSMR